MSSQDAGKSTQAKNANQPSSHPQSNVAAPTAISLSQAIIQRALATPRSLAPTEILQLQRLVGNQAVQRMLQRSPQDGFAAGKEFESQLSRTKGGGSPLPKKTKSEFEQSFGANFDNVRVHTNAASNQLNRSIQAKAFTHGNDIHFGAGQYNPASSQGKHLLAHELTHTIQQTGGKATKGVQTKLEVGAANDHDEQEADRIATQVTKSNPAAALQPKRLQKSIKPEGAAPGIIQRKLNFKVSDLRGGDAVSDKYYAMAGEQETYIVLKQMLNRYHQSTDLQEQLHLLNRMDVLIKIWLSKHDTLGKSPGSKTSRFMKNAKTLALGESNKSKKSYSLHFLSQEIDQELPIVRNAASQKYLSPFAEPDKNAKDDYTQKLNSGGMSYLTEKGVKSVDLMKKLFSGNITNHAPGTAEGDNEFAERTQQSKEVRELAQKHKLSIAEATAIMIYSAEDFRYMNPTVAGNMGWLHSQLPKTTFANKNIKDEVVHGNPDKRPDAAGNYAGVKMGEVKPATKEQQDRFHAHAAGAKAEGTIHSQMAISGMNKLDDWPGTTFRGVVLTPTEFQQQYPVHGEVVMPSFTSTTTTPLNAEAFIAENKADGKVNVYLELHVTKGKDIKPFSYSKAEDEILLMPGATFKVVSVTQITTSAFRDPAQKVVLQQTS